MNVVDSESRAHNGEFNYRAFIAHSRADEQWGAWLQKSLEAYKAPRRLVGREGREGAVPRRLVPIYRDDNEISSSKDLGATRRNLLEQSRYLLVVCSPSAATSKWVNEEILQFKRFGYENRILCLIVDGEPNASDKPGLEDSECFCEALRHKIGGDGELADQRAEPIAADIRPGKDGKNGSRLKLVAGLLGVSFDDLRQRDLRRRRWRWIQATAFVLIMVALSVLAGIEANRLALEKAKQRAEFAAEEARRLLRASDVEGSIRTALDGLPSDRSEIDPAVFESLVWTLENAVRQLPLEAVLRGHRGEVLFARFSPDGRRILTAARDWTARIWDVDKGTEIASHSVINLLSTAFSPKGDRVITSQSDKTTRIWDSETGKDVLVLDAQESRTTYAVFDSTGNKVLTGLDDGTLRVWNAKTGKEIATLLGHTKSVTFAAFIQSDDKILTASLDGTVRLWETSTGNPISVIHKQQAAIWSAAMNPAGERLVAGSLGGRAHILEVNTGSAVAVLGEEKRKFMAVRVDPRGKTIATASGSSSGSDYQSAQLWDAETGKQLKTLRGHNHTVLSVAFSPSGTTVITGSKDATARIWNVRTGTELAVLRGHSGDVFQVAFSPSGDRIATA
ncbi:MAG: toll/interleukin-1 receptor domain-containing protein, partial [Woeseia sp.]